MPELLPCPFCGSSAVCDTSVYSDEWVRCSVCYAVNTHPELEAAVEGWNTRTAPAQEDTDTPDAGEGIRLPVKYDPKPGLIRETAFGKVVARVGDGTELWVQDEGNRQVHAMGKQIVDALNASARLQAEWVPVTDRLPDENDTYFAMYRFPGSDAGPFPCTAEFFPENHEDPEWWLIEKGVSDSAEVVAWMPIPPYNQTEDKDA